MNLALMLLAFLVLLLIGVPIAYSIGGSGIVYLILKDPLFLMTFPQRIWSGTNSFMLIAMPLFMLAGELMNQGGLSQRLINFSMLLVRPFGGGLAEVNVVTSMIFGGISGSSVADTSAEGSIIIPEMVRQGYPIEFSAGITVATSTMGMIIPPSIPMLMYAMVTGASVGKLFLAGLIPGLLVGIIQLLLTFGISKAKGYRPPRQPFVAKEAIKTAKDGVLAMFMPILIVLTVSTGIATASESAAVVVLYALILGFFLYKELTTKSILAALKKTAIMSSSIMIIGGFTMIFTWIMAVEQVPVMIANFLLTSHVPAFVIFLFLDVLILFLGTFLDVTPCILLVAPILMPVLRQFGMSELQFGAVLIVGLAMGLVTPPVGMCLNVASKISGLSIIAIFKAALPFLICNLIVLLLVTFIPAVSIWLPGLLG